MICSCFSFTLPLATPEADTAQAAPDAAACRNDQAPPQRRRLLLVADSVYNQELVRLSVEDEPWDIVTAGNGSEAVAAFFEQRFDLVLMDVEMPGMDGCEATTAIRTLERETGLRPTPVVMLTAHAFSEYERKGRAAGCDGFLSKPIRKARLIEELRKHLDTMD